MDRIHETEYLVLLVMLVHIFITPFTKVEESFNIQAIHDLLYVRNGLEEYDHRTFSGVVPRTFMGPLFVSSILFPVVPLFNYLNIEKFWMLTAARFVLGFAVVISFCNFCRCCEKRFGNLTGNFLRLITASQFHFLFYASRTLPNTFALVLVLWAIQLILDREFVKATIVATISCTIFRFELILLFGPIYLIIFARKQFSPLKAILVGLISLVLSLVVTVPLDSFFWNQWIWPEGEVIRFNLILNRSNEYGVSPFLWYFYSALPRALATTLALIPFGFFYERRALLPIVGPVISFIIIYSFLPHKELRFIIYAFPLLNLSAAIFCARIWEQRKETFLKKCLAYGVSLHLIANLLLTAVIVYCSSANYPGGAALINLQHYQRYNRNQNVSVHIDHFSAQNGINKFIQIYDKWEYNKTEEMPFESFKRFDYIIMGFQELHKHKDESKFATVFKEYGTIDGFQRINYKKSTKFPFIWPVVHMKPKVIVLKKIT